VRCYGEPVGELIGNLMRIHWELEGKIVRTHWEPGNNKKNSFPFQLKRAKNRRHLECMPSH